MPLACSPSSCTARCSRVRSRACRPTFTCAPARLRPSLGQPQPGIAAGPAQQAAPPVHGKVVCIGEALFDLIADQKGLPRDKVQSWTPYAGGAPCNVATALARLGLDVVFVTALGNDENGQQLYDLCKELGVKLHAVQRTSQPTRAVYVVRDEQGDREFAGFGLPTDQYSDCFIDPDQLPLDDIKVSSSNGNGHAATSPNLPLQSSTVLVTGTLGLAYPTTAAALHKAVAAAHEGGAVVLVDVNWRPVFWQCPLEEAQRTILEYLQQADIIKLSDADLEALLGIPLATALINPCAVADKFPRAAGVLVTAGGEGAGYCFHNEGRGESTGFVPVFKVETVDTTGAGDAFTAGFIYKMLQAGGIHALLRDPLKLKEAIVFAAATGAATCTKPGAIEGQPSLAEVADLYKQSYAWHNFW